MNNKLKDTNVRKKIKLSIFVFLLIILIFFLSINTYAQEFKRVQRESNPFSITFSFSVTSISSSSYVSYSLNPYILCSIFFDKTFDLFFQFPFTFYYNKTYSVDYITDEVTKEESYLFCLDSIIAGFQYTFYTKFINDIYLYFSYPIGIYPVFYKRSSTSVDKTQPEIRFSLGYRATIIADPLLFSVTCSITGYYNIPALINIKEKWTQQYILSCKINLTIVLNSIVSTSFSITPFFILPEITEFDGFCGYELYKTSLSGQINIGIRISENTSFGISIESSLIGYLMPELEIYFTIRG